MLPDELVELRVNLDIVLSQLAPQCVGIDLSQSVGLESLAESILLLIGKCLRVSRRRPPALVEFKIERSNWRYESTLSAVLLVVEALRILLWEILPVRSWSSCTCRAAHFSRS